MHRRATPDDKAPEPVILITDLLDPDKYPAEDLLTTYRARWGIESVFHKITDVFHLNCTFQENIVTKRQVAPASG